MHSFVNGILRGAFATAVLATAATCASAEQFKITLPMDAQWGRTLLPAGDYTITTSPGSHEMQVFGNGKNISVLVAEKEYRTVPSSEVEVVNVNGTPVVHQLSSVTTGSVYTFLTPPASAVKGSVRRTVAFKVADKQNH